MAQQMQMIASLAVSNQAANERMEKQMNLITNLQQTVANHVIRVSDRHSDASTITSNEQRKRRLPHHTSKSSIRRIHPNHTGNIGPSHAPPDPAPDEPIHDEDANDQTQSNHPKDHMDDNSTNASDNKNMSHSHSKPITHDIQDVNGGIDDNDLINMMAKDAQSIHTTNQDNQAPSGPYGNNDKQC